MPWIFGAGTLKGGLLNAWSAEPRDQDGACLALGVRGGADWGHNPPADQVCHAALTKWRDMGPCLGRPLLHLWLPTVGSAPAHSQLQVQSCWTEGMEGRAGSRFSLDLEVGGRVPSLLLLHFWGRHTFQDTGGQMGHAWNKHPVCGPEGRSGVLTCLPSWELGSVGIGHLPLYMQGGMRQGTPQPTGTYTWGWAWGSGPQGALSPAGGAGCKERKARQTPAQVSRDEPGAAGRRSLPSRAGCRLGFPEGPAGGGVTCAWPGGRLVRGRGRGRRAPGPEGARGQGSQVLGAALAGHELAAARPQGLLPPGGNQDRLGGARRVPGPAARGLGRLWRRVVSAGRGPGGGRQARPGR